MNSRIKQSDIAARLASDPALAGVKIGTTLDPDYLTEFCKNHPSVWVGGQYWTKRGELDYTANFRQHVRAIFRFKVTEARYKEGEEAGDAEDRLNALFDKVMDRLKDWQPGGADTTFAIEAMADGPAGESFVSVDFSLSVDATYSRPS